MDREGGRKREESSGSGAVGLDRLRVLGTWDVRMPRWTDWELEEEGWRERRREG